jgi:glycosyltransferase involved in cell wall biosynthesis
MGRHLKFSIVTPSYNQAPYIAGTIESVLSQEGEFEVEYFVMDGGSTDGSVEIIKSYADRVAAGDWPVKCARISMAWVSQHDKGQSDAINQGLRQSTGDIASYLNSDDLYYPDAFARVTQEFVARPEVDFVYGDGDVIDEVGNLQREWLSRSYNHSVMTSYHFLWNDFTNYIMQQATFWRREVLDKIGYFDESFHYAMDVEYWIRAGHAGLKLHHIPYKLGKFRLIQGTKSFSGPTVFWEDYLEIYRRYRGSRALGIFFAYYYYNLARQFGFDLIQTVEKAQTAFMRWQTLPLREQQAISQQAERGFALACLLVASELQTKQYYEQAKSTFKRGVASRPFLALHPFALGYLLRCVAGPRLATIAERWVGRLVGIYRRVRYEYRYYQWRNTGVSKIWRNLLEFR